MKVEIVYGAAFRHPYYRNGLKDCVTKRGPSVCECGNYILVWG